MTATKDMKDCPDGRIGHICASDKEYMFVLGGYNGYNDEMQTNYLSAKQLWIYDFIVEKWLMYCCEAESCPNDIPEGTSGASSCLIDNFLYLFGGFNDEGNSDRLFRLNLKTLKWKQLEPNGKKPIASDKSVCWEYDNKVYIFGGYGCVPHEDDRDRNYEFVFDPKSHWHYQRGWNNQLLYYDIQLNQWVWPLVKGQVPIPRAAHAAAKIGDRIYIFGGRHKSFRMNDIYFIDMKQMEWKDGIGQNDCETIKPIGRSWHSLTAVSDRHLILFGGFTEDNKPLGDCWIFDIQAMIWIAVDLPFHKPRLWHSAVLSPFGEVMVFGGAKQNILSLAFDNFQNPTNLYSKDLITLRFGPKSLLRLCMDTTVNNWNLLEKFWHFLPQNIKKVLEMKKMNLSTNSAGS